MPKICDALQYAHEEGLVHRDIKPENLLIDKKGRVKIADFGLAKLLRREPLDMTLTLSGTALGTLRYMAPEQMDKPETVDHRADLYSLGVVFYEMLTGDVPMGRFELPSQKAHVDVRLDEIVLHALERDVERRYQHASQVRDDVEKVTSKPQVAPHSAPQSAPVPPSEAPQAAESKASLNALDRVQRELSQTWNFLKGKPRFSRIFGISAGILAFVVVLLIVLPFTRTAAVQADVILMAVLYGVSFGILGIAGLGVFHEWWKSDSPLLWKLIRTVLLLFSAFCFGDFLATHWTIPVSRTPGVDSFENLFQIGGPSPWLEFGTGRFTLIWTTWAWAVSAGGWLSFFFWRESFRPRSTAKKSADDAAEASTEDCAKKRTPVERARASWFGRRSERFRTLLPPALIFLELLFILASFGPWFSPWSQWFEWTRTYTPHKRGIVDSTSSFAFHPLTLSFLLLLIGFTLPFIAARLSRIDNLVRYGRRFRELRKDIQRRAKLKIFGCLAAAILLPFLLVVLVESITHGGLNSMAVVTNTEDRLAPNSKAYDELLIDIPFYSKFENGVEHYRRPNQWDMAIGLKTKDHAEPVTMEIEMPSLKASYDNPKWSNAPHQIVLDLDELTLWLGERGQADVKDEKVKKEATELMALLKQFSRRAPATHDEYMDARAELMPDFRFAGYQGLGGSHASTMGDWLMGIYLASAVLFLALYFVVGIRIQRAAFALDREVREHGESVLARAPLPCVKFAALPRTIRMRAIRRGTLAAVGLLLLPVLAARWESAEPVPVKQTWHQGFAPLPTDENGVARPSPLLKHFQEVILTFTEFGSYERDGETWFVQPRPFQLDLTFCRPKNFSDQPGEFHEVIRPGQGVPEGETFSFTVQLPGLHADMDYLNQKSSVTLDEQELLLWMENTIATTPVRPAGASGMATRSFNKPDGTQVTLYRLPMSETPELKSLAADLMAFLKRYAISPPTTRDSFLAAAKRIPSLNGSSSTTTFHAEWHRGAAIFPALAVATLLFLALLPLLKRSAVRAAMREGALNLAPAIAA